MKHPPIFVVGIGRSGTTFLAQTLGMHPEIAHFPRESKYMVDFFIWMEKHSPPDLDRVAIARDFISGCLESYRRSTGRPRIVEKTPLNLTCINWIARCFPNSKIIHIYRDPRDVAASFQKEVTRAPASSVAEAWNRHVRNGLRKQVALGPKHVSSVRYEDLVGRPQQTFTDICRFIEVDPEPLVERAVQTVTTGAVGRWRRFLSPEDVAVVENICGDLCRELGYELSGIGSSASVESLTPSLSLCARSAVDGSG